MEDQSASVNRVGAMPGVASGFGRAGTEANGTPSQVAGLGLGFARSLPAPALPAPVMRAVGGMSVALPTELPSLQPLRILVVDDHRTTLRMLLRLLGDCGYVVAGADCFADALAMGRRQTFDVLIADIQLPDRSGWDLPRELAGSVPEGDWRAPATSIALSGHGTEEDIQHSLAAGFATHLVKPIELRRIEAALARLVPGCVVTG